MASKTKGLDSFLSKEKYLTIDNHLQTLNIMTDLTILIIPYSYDVPIKCNSLCCN